LDVLRYQPHIDEPLWGLEVCNFHDVPFQPTQGKYSSFVGAIDIDKIAMQNGKESPERFLIVAESFELKRGDCPIASALGNRFDLPTDATATGEEVDNHWEKNERTDCQKRYRRHATDFIPLKRPKWMKFHEMLSLNSD